MKCVLFIVNREHFQILTYFSTPDRPKMKLLLGDSYEDKKILKMTKKNRGSFVGETAGEEGEVAETHLTLPKKIRI